MGCWFDFGYGFLSLCLQVFTNCSVWIMYLILWIGCCYRSFFWALWSLVLFWLQFSFFFCIVKLKVYYLRQAIILKVLQDIVQLISTTILGKHGRSWEFLDATLRMVLIDSYIQYNLGKTWEKPMMVARVTVAFKNQLDVIV